MFNNGRKKEALAALKREKTVYDSQLDSTIGRLKEFHEKKLEIKGIIEVFNRTMESIGGKPDFIKILINEVKHEIKQFDSELKKLENEVKEQNHGTLTGAGVATGAGIAAFGPSAAMAIATTFGTASTGTAIATLSGAAATNAALAWLGGGALVAGGGGVAGGSALIAATGPVGWAVGGTALLLGGFMANSKNKEIARKAEAQIKEIKDSISKLKKLIDKVNIKYTELAEKKHVFIGIVGDKCNNFKNIKHWSELTVQQQEDIGTACNVAKSMVKILNEKID